MSDLQKKLITLIKKNKVVDTDLNINQELSIKQSFLKKNKPVLLIGALFFLLLITTISLLINLKTKSIEEKIFLK